MKSTFSLSTFLIVFSFAQLACHQHVRGLEIYSNANDGFLEVRDALPPAGSWPVVHPDTFGDYDANVGEWFGPGLTTTVLPFQLPNFGGVANPFLTADLGIMVYEIGSGPTTTDVDLYAVRVDSDPAILTTDWYNGSAFDPNATLIQESFLTPASSAGYVGAPNNHTNATGDANLVSYLNAAYASGAGAGDFVFLRLSYGGDAFSTVYDAYKLTVREAGQQGEWPVISFTTNNLPGDVDGNSVVDLIDFGIIRDNWLETNDTFGMTLAISDGDLDLNGEVSLSDFRAWKNVFNGPPEVVAAAFASLGVVPEPCSAALALAAGVGLMVRFRKR